MNQLSPYLIRRNMPAAEPEVADLHEFMNVDDRTSPLTEYWQTIKRHCWLILVCGFILLAGAVLYTFTRTPLYTAQTVILIERKPPQVLKEKDALSESVEYAEYYKTQYEILKSRALASRVIREEGLEAHPVFAGDKKDQRTGLVAGVWQGLKNRAAGFFQTKAEIPKGADPSAINPTLIDTYLAMLEIKPVRSTSLVDVVFHTPEPELSARLANAHAFAYVRYGLDLRSQTNEEAMEFLQKKLLELKERVEHSEASLNNYRRDKGIISLDDKENIVVNRLVDLNKRLTEAEAERISLQAQVQTIQKNKFDALPVITSSPVIQGMKQQIAKYEAEYASLAKEFKPGYPPLDNLKVRLDETRQHLRDEIRNEVKGIESAYTVAKNKEAELRSQMNEQKQATLNLKDSAVQYAILAREVDTNRQLYDSVLQRIKEMGVAAQIRNSNIYVMEKAQPPLWPSYPSKRRGLLLGLCLGLTAGIGLAFLLEQMDSTFRSVEEAERYVSLPSLGVVPDFARVDGRQSGYVSQLVQSAKLELPFGAPDAPKTDLVLAHHPHSVVFEAYRTLRSALLLSQAGDPPRTILMTSATRGEGKTTSLVNTAIVFAQMGVRVLVIDADLRRPRCHHLLKVENTVGLAEVLAGQLEPKSALQSTAAENLFFICSGATPPNPAELLGSNRMHQILNELRDEFEFIFIDSSPVMAVSDAILLSTMVEGVVLVVNGKTPKQTVRTTRTRLNTRHTKVLGMLLNRIDMREGGYANYYSQYYDYYGKDSARDA
jgi:succinoglycan biosynthesis transport protein ExoP